MVVHGDELKTLGDDDALWLSYYTIKVRAILGVGRDDAKVLRILNRYVRWISDGEEFDRVPTRSSTRRVDRQIVESGECEGSDSQDEAGRGVSDVSTVGRIVDATLSQCGDEGSVFVARQTRSVVLSNGAGERHAETERTIDDQSEAR